jgi:hypothetical protein
MKKKLINLGLGVLATICFVALVIAIFAGGLFLTSLVISLFEFVYPFVAIINVVLFGLMLILLAVAFIPRLRSLCGIGMVIGCWVLSGLYWLACFHVTYAEWGLAGIAYSLMFFVFLAAPVALLIDGSMFKLATLLFTFGVLVALGGLGVWFSDRGQRERLVDGRVTAVVALEMIAIVILMSSAFSDPLI